MLKKYILYIFFIALTQNSFSVTLKSIFTFSSQIGIVAEGINNSTKSAKFKLANTFIGPKRKSSYRLSIAPVYGFYKINKNHATKVQPKLSTQFNFKHEFTTDRQYKAFFSYGVEYFLHGLNYNSYYFKPDTLQLYDKNFDYTHGLILQELALPLQFRYSFFRENNALFSPYFAVGYQLRFMLPAKLNITQNGNPIKEELVDVTFKNPLFYKNLNSGIYATAGFQKNGINGAKTGFFIELQTKYGFSPYSFYTKYVATSLFTNSVHVAVNIGLKF